MIDINTIMKMVKRQKVAFITSEDDLGYPNVKAMLPPRLIEDNCFFFSTNTSSMRVKQYRKNNKASIYFYKKGLINYYGVMFVGTMEVITDEDIKKRIWRRGDTMFYKQGVTDPDYCVLRFTAYSGRYYNNLKTESFTLRSDELVIENEKVEDYEEVEKVTRRAFWNQYAPGCNEHYMVHIMREHEDFIKELDYVAKVGERIVGNIMYTKAKLIDEAGSVKDVLSFGPISVLPEYQRRGIGKKLIDISTKKAISLGYDTVVIFGTPDNYVSSGFKCCQKYNICMEDNNYPTALLIKELETGALDGRKWYFHESRVCDVDNILAEEYDKKFDNLDKLEKPSQESFYIHSHSILRK